MDDLVKRIARAHTPEMNPDIVNGLATKYIPRGIEWIDGIFRSVAQSFPQGFEYVGCGMCSPREEFREVTKQKSGARRSYDTAQSDLYMVKYQLRYDGKDLPLRYIYHPFVRDAGTMYLSGSEYMCSPVLSDRVITAANGKVFVRLLRDKVNFEREKHSVVVDGKRMSVSVVYSNIYKRNTNATKVPPLTKANTTPVHYLIARFGFTKAMEMLMGFSPEVGYEINTNTHNPQEYVIFESTMFKPRTYVGDFYIPSRIKMAVPRHLYNHHVVNMIGSVYYIIDHFPEDIKIEYLNNTEWFQLLLGNIIFASLYGEGTRLQKVKDHFVSLSEAVDFYVKMDLDYLGYRDVNDFYDIMVLVTKFFNELILIGNESVNSMYGKELSVLYNVYYPISHAIVNMSFVLGKAASKRKLTEKEILKIMNKALTQGKIYELTNQHISMSSVSYSGDNKFYKITSVIVPQTAKNGQVKKGSKATPGDQVKTLHYSFAEAGGYLNLSKSDPSGFARINPYVMIDEKSTILQKPNLKPILDKVNWLLKHKRGEAYDVPN